LQSAFPKKKFGLAQIPKQHHKQEELGKCKTQLQLECLTTI
jgi:hypothetical protein